MSPYPLETLFTKLSGCRLLTTPLLNKGTAFTTEERDEFHLHGLIPPHVSSIEEQLKRRYANFCSLTSGINKYIFLKSLQDRNEILFYRLASEHCEEMMPYIYTPTVGDASLDYSMLYMQNRGLFLSYQLKDKMEDIIANCTPDDVDVIVVTDGSRILGLGDMGIGGMTIPIGKLALYTLFGGIHPGKTLPIMLDVGTNNNNLLQDPLYLGSKHARIQGREYDEFVDLFIKLIKKRYPKVLLQWEDFSKDNAKSLLHRYEDSITSFNDDIQGTAAVTLSAILAALKGTSRELKDQRIAIFGGGSAGIGIATYLAMYMKKSGLTDKEIFSKFYVLDIHGLIHSAQDIHDPHQRAFAQDYHAIKHWKVQKNDYISLEDVVDHAKPTILLGVSAQPNAFSQSVIEKMSAYCDRPIIFPLSNPTSKAEAIPQDLIEWSKGSAIVATGSPFHPVMFEGKTYPIAQCNNVCIFPGVGLGVTACQATKVTDEMFLRAAEVLSEYAPIIKDPYAPIFPSIKELRKISRTIGIAVATLAIRLGLSNATSKDPVALVDNTMWYPNYPHLKKLKD